MREISRWMSSRSNGVTNVVCSSCTVSCVMRSARVFGVFDRLDAAWRGPCRVVVVAQHVGEGDRAFDDELGVAVEKAEEIAPREA